MRYTSIDCLRTLAIFVMVCVHFCENLSGATPKIAGLGAPLFLFLSGISYRLWLNGRLARGIGEVEISKITVRRGLFLFGLGFAFNILVWLPEDTFNWDVLTLIGVGLVTLNMARRVTPLVNLTACVMLLVLSPIARQTADWEAYWKEGFFDPDLSFTDVTLGFLATGYFPIFPWLLYPLVGFVVGTDVFGTAKAGGADSRALRRGLLTGGGLLVVSAAAIAASAMAPSNVPEAFSLRWTMFPASVSYVLGSVGFAYFSFCLAYRLLDERLEPNRWRGLRELAATFSRHSLTAYVLHHVVHLYPLWLRGVLAGQETTYYWRQAMSTPLAVALAIGFLPCLYLFFRWLDRHDRGGIESWMRWLCD